MDTGYAARSSRTIACSNAMERKSLPHALHPPGDQHRQRQHAVGAYHGNQPIPQGLECLAPVHLGFGYTQSLQNAGSLSPLLLGRRQGVAKNHPHNDGGGKGQHPHQQTGGQGLMINRLVGIVEISQSQMVFPGNLEEGRQGVFRGSVLPGIQIEAGLSIIVSVEPVLPGSPAWPDPAPSSS